MREGSWKNWTSLLWNLCVQHTNSVHRPGQELRSSQEPPQDLRAFVDLPISHLTKRGKPHLFVAA